MIFGAILAGGTGTRMGNYALPKQFLDLGGRPVIIHTIEKFLTCPEFDALYVGMHEDWISYMQDMLKKHVPSGMNRITVVRGGSDRNSTLFNVIAQIEADHGAEDDHIIVTHDAVRPFVTLRMIRDNIEAAEKYGAVDTVIPSVDTIVRSEDKEFISSVPDRRQMYQGQTPQSFKIGLLKRLYASLSDEEKEIMTDACKICVVRDQKVKLVQGSDTNIKITTPGDYKIAQAMVAGDSID